MKSSEWVHGEPGEQVGEKSVGWIGLKKDEGGFNRLTVTDFI
jgi:hypothetical protein